MTSESKRFEPVFDIDGDNNIQSYPCGVDDMLSSIKQFKLSVILLGDVDKVNSIVSINRSAFSTLGYTIRTHQYISTFTPIQNNKYFITSNSNRNDINSFIRNNTNFRGIFIFHTDS